MAAQPMKPWKNYSGQARKRLGQLIAVGEAVCSRCGRPVTPGQLWDVDHLIGQDIAPHLIDDPTNWAVAHRRCNRAAGAAYGNRKRAPQRRTPPPPSRAW